MMRAEGGLLELVDSYGKLIFAILIVILILMAFLVYISTHPDLGISLPPLFGGNPGG